MQAQAYEGYFNNGQFYVNGKTVRIPEKQRIFLAIFNDTQNNNNKHLSWNSFKRAVKDTQHENDLLDFEAFDRSDSGRDLIDFNDEV